MDVRSTSQREKKHANGIFRANRGLIIFILSALLFRIFLFTVCLVPSGSMIPTILVGDRVVISKFSYGISRYTFLYGGKFNYFSGTIGRLTHPRRGDIVVFTSHYGNEEVDYVKRVVGIPGDKIQMIEGVLYVNGRPSPMEVVKQNCTYYDSEKRITGTIYNTNIVSNENRIVPYQILEQYPMGSVRGDDTPEYIVPEDCLFCMGDNRQGSGDSREMERMGFVNKKYLIGPALFVYLSIDTEGFVWAKPWTWLCVITGIRFSRMGFKRINETLPPLW